MPWGLIIAVGFMALEYGYHRLYPTPAPQPTREVTIPITTDGTPVPLIYGRVRVNAPILVYTGAPAAQYITDPLQGGPSFEYYTDALFVLGVPFQDGRNGLFLVYAGDTRLGREDHGLTEGVNLEDLVGDGSDNNGMIGMPGSVTRIAGLRLLDSASGATIADGFIEMLAGGAAQAVVDPTSGAIQTVTGYVQTTSFTYADPDQPWRSYFGHVDPFQIPGYRGFLTALMWNTGVEPHWVVGLQAQLPAYTFEARSWPGSSALGLIGDDCNPIDVIYDLLTGSFGKLGISPTLIDSASFTRAGLTLLAEGHGYSRCFDTRMSVNDMLTEICTQIDAVLFQDPTTGTIKIKLIRADYDTATLPIINPDNCEELQNFFAAGWTDVINRVVLTFTDRVSDYKPGTSIARSQANAVGQDGQVNEMQISVPGICLRQLADQVALRILAATSRPLMKVSVIVNRSFLRVLPGDAVKLNWPEANISNIIFRVAGGTRGTFENGAIKLDLVQDYFYTHRNQPPIGIIESFGGAHTFGDELP